jgi:hypothetical protein
MKAGDCIGYLKPLIRRASLDRFRAIYDPALRNSEDYYLVAELLVQGARMLYVSEPGYRYTRSPASTSHRLKSEHTRAWLDAEARYVRRYGAALTAGQLQALARRSRALRHVDQLIAATEALKSHRIGEFLRLLAAVQRRRRGGRAREPAAARRRRGARRLAGQRARRQARAAARGSAGQGRQAAEQAQARRHLGEGAKMHAWLCKCGEAPPVSREKMEKTKKSGCKKDRLFSF